MSHSKEVPVTPAVRSTPRYSIAISLAVGLCLVCTTHSAWAKAHKGRSHRSAAQGEVATSDLKVDIGGQRIVRLATPIRRVAVGAPKIADVEVINARELLVIGRGAGVTNVLVWSRSNGAATEYKVRVGYPTDASTDADFSKSTVGVDGSLGGETPNLIAHRAAVLSATHNPGTGSTNSSESGTSGSGETGVGVGTGGTGPNVADRSSVVLPSQVMSQVKIVEVNRTTLQEYGFNFFKNTNSVIGSFSTPSSVSGVQSTQVAQSSGTQATTVGALSILSSNGFLPIQSAFNAIFGSPKNGIFGALSILESKGLARTLAEPSLTATSGQTASFLAGGEFPIPVPQSGGGGSSGTQTITIEFKEFGVRLNLTPTVLARDRVALKIAPEVSELDYQNGLNYNGFTVPGLIVRRTDTTVELGDGESFVLSGLVSNNVKNSVSKVPWLGDLPIIGAFFRDTSISLQDKELIMIVTPHLVHPLRRDDQLPPLPGESIQHYRPTFAETMFLERGEFGQSSDSGYSR